MNDSAGTGQTYYELFRIAKTNGGIYTGLFAKEVGMRMLGLMRVCARDHVTEMTGFATRDGADPATHKQRMRVVLDSVNSWNITTQTLEVQRVLRKDPQAQRFMELMVFEWVSLMYAPMGDSVRLSIMAPTLSAFVYEFYRSLGAHDYVRDMHFLDSDRMIESDIVVMNSIRYALKECTRECIKITEAPVAVTANHTQPSSVASTTAATTGTGAVTGNTVPSGTGGLTGTVVTSGPTTTLSAPPPLVSNIVVPPLPYAAAATSQPMLMDPVVVAVPTSQVYREPSGSANTNVRGITLDDLKRHEREYLSRPLEGSSSRSVKMTDSERQKLARATEEIAKHLRVTKHPFTSDSAPKDTGHGRPHHDPDPERKPRSAGGHDIKNDPYARQKDKHRQESENGHYRSRQEEGNGNEKRKEERVVLPEQEQQQEPRKETAQNDNPDIKRIVIPAHILTAQHRNARAGSGSSHGKKSRDEEEVEKEEQDD